MTTTDVSNDLASLAAGTEGQPHAVLGTHQLGAGRWRVRAWRPEATAAAVLLAGGGRVEMAKVHPGGGFEAVVEHDAAPTYRFEVTYPGGASFEVEDPYRFWPTVGDIDLHLIGEGRHRRLWRVLGARPMTHQGIAGTAFSVWAPSARSVRVIGDFNSWDGRLNPMRSLGASGVWELFLPGVGPGERYKYEVVTQEGQLRLKADPMARSTEVPPATASVVADLESPYQWGDASWMEQRRSTDQLDRQLSIYEVHLASWRPGLGYRELAHELASHVSDLGFTHVELMPVAEHPFGGSWGYQVTSYYAPTSRLGSPDDLRYFVDVLHRAGIGVIVDWVPAHFPRDDWALARFDGTALYEHDDPRQGAHPDWGTLVFNFGRNEVRNFLVANALYWLEEFHIDGLRVDAVASMLYLDYSRKEGEWVPNRYGGRENLEAIEFLKEFNELSHAEHPGVLTIAEESTAWPAVSRPLYLGGLGFSHKWNMGWMHDTLDYFSHQPIHRRYHHHELTFGLLYAFSENFLLPLSHDEVVHGKGSLLNKMAGDRWQKFANLRSMYAWMWAHPGKQLLFMGGELAMWEEWSESRGLPWEVLDHDDHRGIRDLLRALNHLQRDEPALWERDFDPAGFRWIAADDVDQSVYAFARWSADRRRAVVCVANMTPVPRQGYRVGLPWGGWWRTLVDTDATWFGGSGYAPRDGVEAESVAWHGFDTSAELTLPPMAVQWYASERP